MLGYRISFWDRTDSGGHSISILLHIIFVLIRVPLILQSFITVTGIITTIIFFTYLYATFVTFFFKQNKFNDSFIYTHKTVYLKRGKTEIFTFC